MSLMDKIKSMFSGGSSDSDSHAGHDHSGDDHSHEPAAPPPDPAGMPTSEPDAEDKPGY